MKAKDIEVVQELLDTVDMKMPKNLTMDGKGCFYSNGHHLQNIELLQCIESANQAYHELYQILRKELVPRKVGEK